MRKHYTRTKITFYKRMLNIYRLQQRDEHKEFGYPKSLLCACIVNILKNHALKLLKTVSVFELDTSGSVPHATVLV